MEPEPLPLKKRKRKKNLTERKTTDLDDAALCQRSRTWQLLFVEKLSAFEAFDPELNAAFAANWLQLIEQLEFQETDKTERDGVGEHTAVVKEKINNVLTQIGSVEYFVKKAFPNNGRMLLEFGFAKLGYPAVLGTARFVVGAYAMGLVLADYETALLAAGMPATQRTDLETACDKLGEAEIFQEYNKSLRIRSTAKRIDLFNTLYDTYRTVHKAANVIYLNNPILKGQFEV